MKNIINHLSFNTIIQSILFLSLLMTTHASAAQKGHLKVTSTAQKMTLVKQNGKQTYKFEPAKLVLPGELVQYNTKFENISNQPANNIHIVNPIPKNTVYLQNSATGRNTQITLSVDGGKTWGKAGTLKVRNHNGQWRPAKPNDYTHIRWSYLGHLAPRDAKAVSFRVRLL